MQLNASACHAHAFTCLQPQPVQSTPLHCKAELTHLIHILQPQSAQRGVSLLHCLPCQPDLAATGSAKPSTALAALLHSALLARAAPMLPAAASCLILHALEVIPQLLDHYVAVSWLHWLIIDANHQSCVGLADAATTALALATDDSLVPRRHLELQIP